MDELDKHFDKYFNEILRDYLKYPEIFKVISDESSVTLIPDRESELLKKIKIDSKLKNQILHQIKGFLESKNMEVQDIHFYSHGTDIIIKYTPTYLYITEAPLYANIYSYLSDKDLTIFCNLGGAIQKICDNQIFWIELIKNRFPQFYLEMKGGYNWKNIYIGLLAHEEFINDSNNFEQFTLDFERFRQGISKKRNLFYHDHPEYEKYRSYYEKYGRNGYWIKKWMEFQDGHPETVKYLIFNNLVKFGSGRISSVISKMTDITLAKKTLLDYPLSDENFDIIFSNVADENNIELFKLLLQHKNMKSFIDDGYLDEYFNDFIEDSPTLKPALKPEMFELLRTNSRDPRSYEDYLGSTDDTNLELIDYLITKLPDNFLRPRGGLFNFLTDVIIPMGKSNIFERLTKKYSNELTESNMKYLVETAQNAYAEDGDTSILDVLGVEPDDF